MAECGGPRRSQGHTRPKSSPVGRSDTPIAPAGPNAQSAPAPRAPKSFGWRAVRVWCGGGRGSNPRTLVGGGEPRYGIRDTGYETSAGNPRMSMLRSTGADPWPKGVGRPVLWPTPPVLVLTSTDPVLPGWPAPPVKQKQTDKQTKHNKTPHDFDCIRSLLVRERGSSLARALARYYLYGFSFLFLLLSSLFWFGGIHPNAHAALPRPSVSVCPSVL